jgi:hypothetical protein
LKNQEGKHDQAIATVKVFLKLWSYKLWAQRSGGYGKSYDAEANIERSNCTRCDRQFLKYQVVAQAKTELARIKNVQAKPTHP